MDDTPGKLAVLVPAVAAVRWRLQFSSICAVDRIIFNINADDFVTELFPIWQRQKFSNTMRNSDADWIITTSNKHLQFGPSHSP